MAFDLWAVSEAIAARAAGLTGMVEGYAYEPANPTTPCVIVRWPAVPILGDTHGGHLVVDGELLLIPGELIDYEGAETLFGWLSGGPGGVRQVMAGSDATFGGLINDFTVSDVATIGELPTVFGPRYGATVPFRLTAWRD